MHKPRFMQESTITRESKLGFENLPQNDLIFGALILNSNIFSLHSLACIHSSMRQIPLSAFLVWFVTQTVFKNLRGKLMSKYNNLLVRSCRTSDSHPSAISTSPVWNRVWRKANVYLFETFNWLRVAAWKFSILFSIYHGLSMHQFTCNSIRCGDPMTQRNPLGELWCCTRRRFISNKFWHRNPISASGWAKNVHTKSVAPKAIIVCFHIAWCNNLFIRFLL